MKDLKKFLLIFGSLFVFNSCGMDTVYYMVGPTSAFNVPVITSANYSNPSTNYETAYMSFTTKENSNSEYIGDEKDFKFLGTAIYYKIYNNYQTMNSDISTISGKINDTNEASAASYVIDSLKYQPLKCTGTNAFPLIAATGVDRKIYIRLTNYNEDSADEDANDAYLYRARVLVGGNCEVGKKDSATLDLGQPIRSYSSDLTFDFGRKYTSGKNSGNYVYPQSEDDDVKQSSSSSSSGIWYVCLYAIGVGQDLSFSFQYSNALHLGAVAIDQNSEHN